MTTLAEVLDLTCPDRGVAEPLDPERTEPDDGPRDRKAPDPVTDPSVPDPRLRESDREPTFESFAPAPGEDVDAGAREWVIDQAAIGGSTSGVTATGLADPFENVSVVPAVARTGRARLGHSSDRGLIHLLGRPTGTMPASA